MEHSSDALVLFGATGDLAYKKLFPALYRMERGGKLGIPVIGVAYSDWGDDELRNRAEKSIRSFFATMEAKGQIGAGEELDEQVLKRLLANLTLVAGDYRERATFDELARRLGSSQHPLHYLAIPPDLFSVVVASLDATGLARGARVVVEKPFGRNRASAAKLNEDLYAVFPEEDIFRIDHFLGKAAVESIMSVRTANLLFSQAWNADFVESVAVSALEDLTVEGRGGFYDAVGTIRDVVQNHLLEVVAILAMEPPTSLDADVIADEKVKLLRSVRSVDPEMVVRGQYRTYRDEDGVEPWSVTETFAAMRLEIDNWRWKGVPFFIRAGKALDRTATEAVVTFKKPAIELFGENPSNQLRFVLTGDGSVTFELVRAGTEDEYRGEPVRLTVASPTDGPHLPQDAYARLLRDATRGRKKRFARADSVDHAWRVVEPILGVEEVEFYERGSRGPSSAGALTEGYTAWPEPL